MRAVFLDAETVGDDVHFQSLSDIVEVTVYPLTAPQDVSGRIADADIVVVNKIRLNAANLSSASHLSLICVAATGYDNIDTEYCRLHGIAVCNVVGYSTHSVAQLTVALVLHLYLHLSAFAEYVGSGSYSASGVANRLYPAFHELCGKTWGIVGGGNIGRQVAAIAAAFGCRVIVCRRKTDPDYPTVSLIELCRQSDIITVHTPLTADTRGMISRQMVDMMKQGVVFVNTARGGVTDEQALADAVLSGKLGGLGTDVYAEEPFSEHHPFYPIRNHPNVCMTPHMAWGAWEARQRCIDEIAENIRAFLNGEMRSRIV